ncbi:cation transporter [Phycicoccus avicenniae]|uniref:cation transporter n=1 Tax=Phycicoccus avicenniae TaxID=2828860 RepID=UPI003D2CA78D
MTSSDAPAGTPRLRRTVGLVAALNLAGFAVEAVVALAVGSVALVADSVDFLEDASVNGLILIALGWPLARRARAGRVMAGILLVPALAALWQAVEKARDPVAPDVTALVLTALGAALVNGVCALLLVRMRRHGGSLGRAAWLSARNDVAVNLAVVLMAGVTAATRSGWPDLVLGVGIVVLNGTAALEVWRLAGRERLEARTIDEADAAHP